MFTELKQNVRQGSLNNLIITINHRDVLTTAMVECKIAHHSDIPEFYRKKCHVFMLLREHSAYFMRSVFRVIVYEYYLRAIGYLTGRSLKAFQTLFQVILAVMRRYYDAEYGALTSYYH
jgi:hypothetical protein